MFSHLVNLGNSSKSKLFQISNLKSYIARGLTASNLNLRFLCSHPTILSASLLMRKRCLLLITCSSQYDCCALIPERCTNEAQEIVSKVPRPYFLTVWGRDNILAVIAYWFSSCQEVFSREHRGECGQDLLAMTNLLNT